MIFWNDLRSSGKADLVNIYAQSITLSSCTVGDLNNDGISNVIDVVSLVNVILDSSGSSVPCAADINNDGIANVIDIVSLVNIILSK